MSAILKFTKYLKTSAVCLKSSSLLCNTRHFSSTPNSITPHLSWFNQQLPRPATSRAKEQQYIEKDRVPPNHQLIYRAPMEAYVAWSMNVSSFTATVIGAAALYQFASNKPLLDPLYETTLVIDSDDIYMFAFGFLAINAVLRLVIAKFPLRIYKNNGQYLAVYYSQIPGGISHHNFDQGDVKEVSYAFSPWNGATYKLGRKTSLILEHYFKTAWEFEQMMKKKEE